MYCQNLRITVWFCRFGDNLGFIDQRRVKVYVFGKVSSLGFQAFQNQIHGNHGKNYCSKSLKFDTTHHPQHFPTSLGGVALNLVQGNLRVIEIDLVDRFLISNLV